MLYTETQHRIGLYVLVSYTLTDQESNSAVDIHLSGQEITTYETSNSST